MATSSFLYHRRNGIAAIVMIAVILTMIILLVVKPTTHNEYIIYGIVICALWLIPSSMYYMLILNYKNVINTDIIPKITIATTATIQAMATNKKYSPEELRIIQNSIIRETINHTMGKNPQTSDDTDAVNKQIALELNKSSKPINPSNVNESFERKAIMLDALARAKAYDKLQEIESKEITFV